MIRYIHGSQDSLDVDVHYVFDSIPLFREAQEFCQDESIENKNIIVIKDGQVIYSFKGDIDETNNGLIDTYGLHKQEYPLIVTKRMEREKELKYVKSLRCILSLFSRTQYRNEIKKALNSNWNSRINVLKNINLEQIDFSNLQKKFSEKDVKKIIAFQIGQCLGLSQGIELYTKADISKMYPLLQSYLYREDDSIKNLQIMLNQFSNFLGNLEVIEKENQIYFEKEKKYIDLKKEILLPSFYIKDFEPIRKKQEKNKKVTRKNKKIQEEMEK